MYKLFILAALLAVAVARPSHLAAGPLVYSSPAVAVHQPLLANVGAVVKSIPTAVSHQSQSIVHSSAHVVEPVVAPVYKTYAAAAPLVHTYAAAAPVLKSYASPYVQSYGAPLTYAAGPLSYASPYGSPYASPYASSYASPYAAPAHYSAW